MSYANKVREKRADIAAFRKRHRNHPETFRRANEMCGLLDWVMAAIALPADQDVAVRDQRIAELEGKG